MKLSSADRTGLATRLARAMTSLGSAVQAQWPGYLAAFGAVALVSVGIGLLVGQIHVANISMLYLLAVLAVAIYWGSGPAVAASVTAFFTFNWFFVEPRYTLTVAAPGEWIALPLFLATAIATGQLAARERDRAEEA
ncbi:MAG: DUF4118 domain-containing protein [Chloroflexi bacterium]|nr:DUF4118 domain-containing protein [Chloroflexota bacterium]